MRKADLEELEKRIRLDCVEFPEMEKRLMALHESVTRTACRNHTLLRSLRPLTSSSPE